MALNTGIKKVRGAMHEYKAVNKCLEASQMKIEGTGSNLPKSLYFENILLNFKF